MTLHLPSLDQPDNYFIKILIPSICGGAIIGKGGEALIKAQNDSGTKVKLSKANDCYPGTTERICLVQGDQQGICKMLEYINKCVNDNVDNKMGISNPDRHKQTRILIPNSSAGLLIGKEGESINEIKKLSGAYIQVSPKSNNKELMERCVVINGDMNQRRDAIKLIIEKIIQDPKLCVFPNVSYGELISPNSFVGQYSTSVPSATYNSLIYDNNSSLQYQAADASIDINCKNDDSTQLTMPRFPGHRSVSLNTRVLRSILLQNKTPTSASSNVNVMEIAHALQILAQNGCLCQSSSYSALNIGTNSNSLRDSHNRNYYSSSPNSQYSSSRSYTSSFQQLDLLASDSIHGITRTLEVDEVFVGSIIGPKGRSIVELQEITDTNIKVSRKPTENVNLNSKRTVTINGMYENVSRAYLLINDKIQLERAKRDVSAFDTNLSES